MNVGSTTDGETLDSLVRGVYSRLTSSTQSEQTGSHRLPPFVPKPVWTQLGDRLRAKESPEKNVTGDKYITLRLDGGGFSKYLKVLKRHGILEEGFSSTLAMVMQRCLVLLMDRFNAFCGFTQSDEMTVVIAPMREINGVRQPHRYNGRVTKITTTVASLVSTKFLCELFQVCEAKGAKYPEEHLPFFDCRMGVFDTQQEAMSLIWWRAYDCSINGISDAVHQNKGGPVKRENTLKKLAWLMEQGLLPLPEHQAHGSFFVKVQKEGTGLNPKTGETLPCWRSSIERVGGCVLQHVADGTLLTHTTSEKQFVP
jgi:tRNA(His) 5'-end guanylyltransferase